MYLPLNTLGQWNVCFLMLFIKAVKSFNNPTVELYSCQVKPDCRLDVTDE
jgi:hypothetical protein